MINFPTIEMIPRTTGKDRNVSMKESGGWWGKLGKLQRAKSRIWKYLNKWDRGRSNLVLRLSKEAKTLSIKSCLKKTKPFSFHIEKTGSSAEGRKIWLSQMGIRGEREANLKCRLNCLQIFTVDRIIGLEVYLAGYEFRGAQIKADKEIESQERDSIWHQSVVGDVYHVWIFWILAAQ